MSFVAERQRPPTADRASVEAFERRLVNALNETGVVLMISIGHRLKLFDALADGAAVTSDALAARVGLNERYVREWLGSMTAGGIVEMQPEARSYRLPRRRRRSIW